ncbi:hypothetical protein [Stenotrophomonas maltophilia]|uniref:hypothetical protein n=1 Tax=Stenotrophomonas maltophilia TaxID=40324 RepID=UPI00255277EA|nr:hypothetical protein [Stenotrophomonas maltophilia]
MALRLLIDNDVLIKLAHWELLDLLPPSLGVDWGDVATLESLKFRARRGDKKLFQSAEIAAALLDRLMITADLPAADLADISQMQGIVGLDAGEIALLAACLSDPDTMLVTGDKRALNALTASCPPELTERLCGRVICLEQLMVLMAEKAGPSGVIEGVMRCREIDAAVRAVVGPSGCSHASFKEGMDSYIGNLRHATGALLWNGS